MLPRLAARAAAPLLIALASLLTTLHPVNAWAAAEACGPISNGVAAGFQIDGNLRCSGGLGFLDWYQSAAADACLGVLQSGPGLCSIPTPGIGQSLFVQDSVATSPGDDPTVFSGQSNTNQDLIGATQSPWHTAIGSTPQKDDLTETYIHIAPPDANGDVWMIVGAAYRATNGDKHFDFEFNQKGITKSGSLLVGNGLDGGRTAGLSGDIVLSIDYQQGGSSPCVHLRQWRAVGTSFAYVQVNACTPPPGVQRDTAFSAVSVDGTPVPCLVFDTGSGATRTTHYDALQFAEAAINLSCYLPGFDLDAFCTTVSTVMVKTRSSGSSGFGEAQLKDYVLAPFSFSTPPPCAINDPGVVCAGSQFQLCGPAGNYTWEWTGPGIPAGQSTSQCITPTVNVAGTASYHLKVSRGGSCVSECDRDVTVTDVDLSLAKTDITCNGASDGTITATFSGGTAPYSASLDGGGFVTVTSPKEFAGLGPGQHTVVVKDANNCQETKQITLSEPPALTLTLGPTNISCKDAADGAIEAQFGGGTGPYQLKLDGGSFVAHTSPFTFTALGPGQHTVVVKDANNCQLSKQVTLTEPPVLTLSLTPHDISCKDAADGTIDATFGGGTGPYQLQIDGGGFTTQTSPYTFTALGPGQHTVVVKDAHNCQLSKQVTLSEPPVVTLTLDKTDATCNSAGDGTILATFGGGTPPYQLDLDGGGFVTHTSPYTFTGVAAGQHTVIVKDAHNCQLSKQIEVGQPSTLSLSLGKDDITCNGAADGKITATFSGGTSPYQLALDGGAFATHTSPFTFTALGPGQHTVAVKDANNCQDSKQITIIEPGAVSLSLEKTDQTCEGGVGSITATFSGGTPPYEVQLDGGGWSTQTSPYTFTPVGTGGHTVAVRDAHQCSTSKDATILSAQCGKIAPTQTTCSDFISGTAGDIFEICYGVKANKINNTAPGVFFYYSKVTAPSANFTVNVVQLNSNGTIPFFGVTQGNQVYAYSSGCTRLFQGTETSPGQASVNITGAIAGQVFIVSVKYSTSTVVGASVPGQPKPEIHYGFRTEIGGQTVDADPEGLDLRNCVGGSTVADNSEASEFAGIELYRAMPNPFGSGTRMVYDVPRGSERVDVGVYDLAGRQVRQLDSGVKNAGRYQVIWDGFGENGLRLKNGMYFIRALVGDRQHTVRVIMLK